MKEFILKLVTFIGLIITFIPVLAEPEGEEYIFQVNREGGEMVTVHNGFLGLNFSHYVGYKHVSSKIEGHIVHVNCSDPGIIRCSVVTPDGKRHTFNVKGRSFYIDDFYSVFNAMFAIMDNEITEKRFIGETSKKVSAISNEGERTNLAFKLVWRLDERGDGICYMIARKF